MSRDDRFLAPTHRPDGQADRHDAQLPVPGDP
jgi:hypothetical protein